MVTNPLPSLLLALNLFVPGLFLLALQATRRLFSEGFSALITAFGLGLGGWVLVTHVLGLLSGSFVVGLVLSTTTLGVLGYLTARASRLPPLIWQELPSSLLWGFVLLCAIPVAVMAWRWDFHDELSHNGHVAMVASMFNAYPPRNLAFPQYPLQYHYGFDLLCAMFVGLWRVSLVRAVDLATILLFVHTLLALWLLGERVVGRGMGVATAALVMFGAGLPFTCEESLALAQAAGTHVLSSCVRGAVNENPPLIAYFFQHPWSLGLPLALTCLSIQTEDSERHRWLRLGCVGCLLAALCLTQTALFCALAAALPVSELLDERRQPWRRRLAAAVVLLATAVVAVLLLGGFWSLPRMMASRLTWHAGVAADARQSLRWMWGTFGVLPLGCLGVFWLERRRLLFLALAFGGALVINSVRYTDTWDMVKFASVASIGFAVCLVGLLKRLRRSSWSVLSVGAPVLLGLVTTFGGAAFTIAVAGDLPGVPAMYRQIAPSFPADDRAAAELLRARMPSEAVMYRRAGLSLPYALFTGLPQVWVETALPINVQLLPTRNQLVNNWPADEAPYLAQGVRFFVLDGADGALGTIVDTWITKGSAVLLKRFGALRVVELLPTDPSVSRQGGPGALSDAAQR